VHYVVEDDELEATLQHQLDQLLLNGPRAMRAAKALMHCIAGQPIQPPLVAETVAAAARVRSSAEGREGIAAFLEKRRPNWVR
jgi:methylglutaconyl-CoA hydratase